MTELLNCPFCGGEAKVAIGQGQYDGQGYIVFCDNCWVHQSYLDKTEAEAIAAWNTRADDYRQAAEYWKRMYEEAFAERTCNFKPFKGPISDRDEIGERKGVCSECSAYMHEQFNYCQNCGAKVVGE